MKKILVPLCLVVGSHIVTGQRSYQFNTPEKLFTEGKEMFDLRNYPGCTDKLEAYKQQAKDADLIQEANYMLVCAAYYQGKPDAAEILEKYLETYRDSRHANEINFLIGSVYFAQEDYQEAVRYFNESDIDLLSTTQQEEYSFRLAYSLLQNGEPEKAQGYFVRISQIGTTYRQAASYYVAYIDYATGQYNKALLGFNELKQNPEFREQSLYYITQIYFIQNKFDEVIKEGESLISNYPYSDNNTELYRIVGNSYYQLGNEDKAINLLSKYVASASDPLRGDLYILGVSYYNKGRYDDAIQALGNTVIENDALSQNAYLYLGQSYLKLGDKNNARMAFEAAATSAFDRQVQEVAMYNYALLIHETSFTGFGESVTIFEDFLNDFPNSQYADKVNDYLVEVYLTTRNYTAALKSIDKINRPSTKILEAKQNILFQLGTQSFANTKMDEAIDYFNQSIAMGSYNPEARNDAYFWRGESYYRKGTYDKAISDFRTYQNNTRQRNTEMYALSFYNLGYSYFKQKKYNEALTRFRQYTDLEKDQTSAACADAYNRIGDCLFNNRQFAQAEENYARAAQLRPSAGDYAIYQKGFLMGLQKNYRGKISTMDQLINDYPESPYISDALLEKGRSYVLLENSQAAAETFEQLMRRFPQTSQARKAGVQLGLLYFNNNQPEKAAEAYKKVVSNYPGSEEARVALQDLKSVYIDLNDINAYATYVNSLGGSVRIDINEQDSLTYIAAEKLFMRGDNEAARRSLVNYLQSFPQGAFSVNANYYLAAIAFSQKEYEDAKRLYGNVIDNGDIKFLEEAVARKAEIEYLEQDYTSALVTFKQLRGIAENPENKEAARLGILRTAQATNQPNDALSAADELLKNPKLSPEVSTEAHYARAKAYISLGQPNRALPDLVVISKDTRTEHGAEAKYLLAQLYFDNNENDKAEKELMNFIENGTPHQYWLARGFILLADIYISQQDDFQARQYLTSLQNNYKGNDDIAGMIEDRLGKLNK